MTAHRIGFLIWPSTKALTLALAEEALRVAQRVHPAFGVGRIIYEKSAMC
jgi:transcriptional regulator GlxA family with amidase domain